MPDDSHADDPHAVTVSLRRHGRLYEATAYPNGSASLARDGVWLCNADWNGRALYTGDHELHPDLAESNTILESLATALRERGAVPLTWKREGFRRD